MECSASYKCISSTYSVALRDTRCCAVDTPEPPEPRDSYNQKNYRTLEPEHSCIHLVLASSLWYTQDKPLLKKHNPRTLEPESLSTLEPDDPKT
jgi:hypothetical protein